MQQSEKASAEGSVAWIKGVGDSNRLYGQAGSFYPVLKGRSLACGVMFSLVFVDDCWAVTALLFIMPNFSILNIDGCPYLFDAQVAALESKET